MKLSLTLPLLFALILVIGTGQCLGYHYSNCANNGYGNGYQKVDTTHLDQLFVVMRHGVRAPWSTYPNDVNASDPHRYPLGRSQLTQFGVDQAKNIGRLLRARYGSWVTNQNRSTTMLRSSAAQRCMDTVQLVAGQLWPDKAMNERPSLYSVPKAVDSVLYEEPTCPQAELEEEANLKKAVVVDYLQQEHVKKLFHYTSTTTGLGTSFSDMNKAFDCARCDQINGHGLPAWAQINETYAQLGNVYTQYLNFVYSSPRVLRLRAGPTLGNLVSNVNGSSKQLFIYGTHDYKIAALIKALGERLTTYPPFAATLLVEITRDPGTQHGQVESNRKYVKVFYVHQTLKVPYELEELKLNKCYGGTDFRCRWEQFLTLINDYLNVDWPQECGLACGQFDFSEQLEADLGNS